MFEVSFSAPQPQPTSSESILRKKKGPRICGFWLGFGLGVSVLQLRDVAVILRSLPVRLMLICQGPFPGCCEGTQ